MLADEGFGQDAGGGGLADAAPTGEQEGVGYAVLADRVLERAGDVFLANDICEPLGAPLQGEYLVGHSRSTLPVSTLRSRTRKNAGRHRPTGPVQARHPCGTREILFTAASFRT